MTHPDILMAIRPVVEAFDKLGLPYYLGGSVASSLYGVARATLDVDLVSDLNAEHIGSLVEMLEGSYYIDADSILNAIHQQSSFNLIHLDTMLKIDIFVVKDRPYSKKEFERKQKDTLGNEQQAFELYIASPEDVILNKLEWFQLGGGVSNQQWKDVLGILKVQQDHLDNEYLRYWATELGLLDLLEKALCDANNQMKNKN